MSRVLCAALLTAFPLAPRVPVSEDTFTLADGQQVRFPLLEGVCSDYSQRLTEWTAEGCPETTLNPQVDWMPDFPSAIERASQQNRPIFMAFFVRENGDPTCDV